ncbi:hypothetical protein I6A60_11435 [Frankia sp. AgB1.9]|nr:hypothetical protein [Frankia sp. AgB1.9]
MAVALVDPAGHIVASHPAGGGGGPPPPPAPAGDLALVLKIALLVALVAVPR